MSVDLQKLTRSKVNAKDQQIAELQAQLTEEKADRKSERFVLSVICIILFDTFSYQNSNWYSISAITILEIFLIFILGKICGMQDVEDTFNRSVSAFRSIRLSKADVGDQTTKGKQNKRKVNALPAANTPSTPETPNGGTPHP